MFFFSKFGLYWVFIIIAIIPLIITPTSNMQAQGTSTAETFSLSTGLGEKVIVKGKGFTITQKELDDTYIRYSMGLASDGQSISPIAAKKLEQDMLEQLILKKIILQNLSQEDKKRGEELAQKEFEHLTNQKNSEAKLRRKALIEGWSSYEDYIQNIKEVFLCKAYLERKLPIDISDKEIQEYYDSHPELFQTEEMFMGGLIFFSSIDILTGKTLTEEEWNNKKLLAQKALQEAQEKTSFEELMKKYSDDIINRNKGLTIIFVKGQLGNEFDSQAFSLRDGQISNLIETPAGIFIVKVAKYTPKGMVPFIEIKNKLKTELEEKARLQELNSYSLELKKEYNVQYIKQ